MPTKLFAVSLPVLVALTIPTQDKRATGSVRDDQGPIAGARIRFQASPDGTATDRFGRFELVGHGGRITAWKEGYFIGGTVRPPEGRQAEITLRRLPFEDNEDYAWVDPRPNPSASQACGNCHEQIYREWAASGHARGLSNRRFLNLYEGSDWHGRPGQDWGLLTDQPDSAAVCSACHAPSVRLDDDGFGDFRKLRGVASLGIHCDYCHKIAAASVEKLGTEHGRFAYGLLRPREGQLFFGPLDDVDRGEDAYSPLYSDSRYCASCHEGIVLGARVYSTYSEWLTSPARRQGKQCQTCHMTPTGTMDNIAPGKGGLKRDPKTLASHAMPGGDAEMLKRCLRLSVEVRREEKSVVVRTLIAADDVGHRVPTGFPERQLELMVHGLDAQGGRITSRGQLFGRRFQALQGTDPVPFWQPHRELEDTRLHPDRPVKGDWVLPAARLAAVRATLVYRRFSERLAKAKGWPENQIIVAEQELPIPEPDRSTRWTFPQEPTRAPKPRLANPGPQ